MTMDARTRVNAGARLDRLPLSSFHRRILHLIGLGMFFDGFDIYLGMAVLTPFLVVPLFTNYGVGGVLALMVGLLAVLIATVLTLGVEPAGRRLEDVAADTGGHRLDAVPEAPI